MLDVWGEAGFQSHLLSVQRLYRQQRDNCIAALDKHLGHVAKYRAPSAGMFVWIELPGVDTQTLWKTLIDQNVCSVWFSLERLGRLTPCRVAVDYAGILLRAGRRPQPVHPRLLLAGNRRDL